MEDIIVPRPRREVLRELKQWCIDNSKPKTVPKPPPRWRPKNITDEATLAAKFEALSKPLPRLMYKKPPRHKHVKIEALSASTTPRLDELASPLTRRLYIRPSQDSTNLMNVIKIKQSAKEYVASPKIEELSAIPRRWKKIRKPRRLGRVNRKALKAKASKRVIKLAVAIKREELQPREFAFVVNPICFKYRPTKRILKLAEPRLLPGEKAKKPEVKKKKKKHDDDDYEDED
ncbi:PREDICTED: uncharacterized protein LOC108557526 [Nicrophorus vespilloides]|uniref:Uncharacterized protein LOC108557526 n=1 Tax=Nicrophorus vespilloides TaxID=110193 RepID=A0ABM1M4Q0_NICVS|nr:PREDICTED: uncharacterized protein LOC108557526 [Nicrophorus vespilloides]